MSKMEFLGRAVSIQCADDLGVFQGTIRSADAESLTIVRAFRNGLPVRNMDTEVTIKACDILDLKLLPGDEKPTVSRSAKHSSTTGFDAQSINNNGPEMVALLMNKVKNGGVNGLSNGKDHRNPKQMNQSSPVPAVPNNQRHGQRSTPQQKLAYSAPNGIEAGSVAHNVQKHFANLLPAKVEVLIGSPHLPIAAKATPGHTPQKSTGSAQPPPVQPQSAQRQQRKQIQAQRNQLTFDQDADDPLDEDFDFEKNLALFDKRAIWNEIDAIQQPALKRQTSMVRPKNYRHDENILPGVSMSSRQISGTSLGAAGNGFVEFSTDDGLVIPSVPLEQRWSVQSAAHKAGLTLSRQVDMLARGTAEMAMQLVGGARRLTPQNQHQWPTILVVCGEDVKWTDVRSATGLAVGRHLASHGLRVSVLGRSDAADAQPVEELALFDACGKNVMRTSSVKELPSCDLVILSVQTPPKKNVARWINDNRAPTLVIDPPVQQKNASAAPTMVSLGIAVRHSIVPVLPVNGIDALNGGKFYVCNLGIPDAYFAQAGIQYQSPFGHKSVIPIHPLNGSVSDACDRLAASSV